jgi:hypothetical protein
LLKAADREEFDFLVERGEGGNPSPDITYVAPRQRIPVVGVILTQESQIDGRGGANEANLAIAQVLDARDVTVVVIDTRIDSLTGTLRTPDQVESLIARMDVVVTTRLHGLVLALRSGVPALAIDPVVGGGKIVAQAEAVGWPHGYSVDGLDHHELEVAFEACLTAQARSLAEACRARGSALVEVLRDRVIDRFSGTGMGGAGVRPSVANDSARFAPKAGGGPMLTPESLKVSGASLELFPDQVGDLLAWTDELSAGMAWWKSEAQAWEQATSDSQREVADVRRGLMWWKDQAETWEARATEEPLP